MSPETLLLFVPACFALNMAFGPNNLLSVTVGARLGLRAAVIAGTGRLAAFAMMIAVAALGMGALLMASEMVFTAVKMLGAAYLVWLGLKSLRAGILNLDSHASATVHKGRSAFLDGFMVQIANPKILLFFSGVLPPFLDIKRPLAPQLIMFACATIGMDLISMSSYGLGGAALSTRMNQPGFRRGFAIFVGVLLITAAVLIVSRG